MLTKLDFQLITEKTILAAEKILSTLKNLGACPNALENSKLMENCLGCTKRNTCLFLQSLLTHPTLELIYLTQYILEQLVFVFSIIHDVCKEKNLKRLNTSLTSLTSE